MGSVAKEDVASLGGLSQVSYVTQVDVTDFEIVEDVSFEWNLANKTLNLLGKCIVAPGAVMTISGTCTIAEGASLAIEGSATLSGTLNNNGVITAYQVTEPDTGALSTNFEINGTYNGNKITYIEYPS